MRWGRARRGCSRREHEAGQLAGVIGVGGNQGTAIASIAMRALPVGPPKLIVSTVASGDVRKYVGDSDIAMLFSVGDLLGGPNPVIERVLAKAAAAVVGMAEAEEEFASSADAEVRRHNGLRQHPPRGGRGHAAPRGGWPPRCAVSRLGGLRLRHGEAHRGGGHRGGARPDDARVARASSTPKTSTRRSDPDGSRRRGVSVSPRWWCQVASSTSASARPRRYRRG